MVLEKILLGVSLAAPIGPVSIEAIRRGLSNGFLAAFSLCLGASLGDSIFLVAAYYGLNSIITNNIIMSLLGLLGAALLIYLGIGCIYNKDKHINLSDSAPRDSIFKSIIVGLGLAIVNPMSLVFWVGVFAASMAATDDHTFLPNVLIIAGVLIWSCTLSLLISLGRKMLNERLVSWISLFSGLLLLFYGLKFGWSAIEKIY